MAVRFRKSIKIAPGVRFNINKKSVGLTIGGKGAKYTVNSRGRRTATVGLPGTGLSYSQTSNSKKRKTKATRGYFQSRRSSFVTTTYVNGKPIKQTVTPMAASPNLAAIHNQVEQVPSRAQLQLAYTQQYFNKNVPHLYFGKYTAVKNILTIPIIILCILFFVYPLLLFPIFACLLFKFLWKRPDNVNFNHYRSAYASMYKGNYKRCVEHIEALIANGMGNDELYRARVECILQMNGTSSIELYEEVNEIKVAINDIDKELSFDNILNNYESIHNRIKLLKNIEASGAFEHSVNPITSLYESFQSRFYYLTKAIDKNYHNTLHDAFDLKTERGKRNRLIKFFEFIGTYYDRFDQETINFIEELKDSVF